MQSYGMQAAKYEEIRERAFARAAPPYRQILIPAHFLPPPERMARLPSCLENRASGRARLRSDVASGSAKRPFRNAATHPVANSGPRGHNHLVSVTAQQAADPARLCSGLECDARSPPTTEALLNGTFCVAEGAFFDYFTALVQQTIAAYFVA